MRLICVLKQNMARFASGRCKDYYYFVYLLDVQLVVLSQLLGRILGQSMRQKGRIILVPIRYDACKSLVEFLQEVKHWICHLH